MKLFDAGKIISSSLGMAVAMSLSSLFLWKSDWLSVPSGSFHGSHGMGIVIGIVTSAAVMLWCSLSRRSLRALRDASRPSYCPCEPRPLWFAGGAGVGSVGTWHRHSRDWLLHAYVLVVLRCVSARYRGQPHDPALCLGGKLFVRTFFESFTGAAVTLAISATLMSVCWGLLLVQARQLDLTSPMASSSFSANRVSYVHGLASFWRSVLYCGTFAFLGGVVRFLAVDTTAMTFINYSSALAGLFAPIVLMALWRFRTVRYNIDGVFRLAFPLIVVALGILPFAAGIPFVILAALLYMTYSFLSLSVQALSIQISHDYGIDPVFCLSFQTLGVRGRPGGRVSSRSLRARRRVLRSSPLCRHRPRVGVLSRLGALRHAGAAPLAI